MWVQLALTRLHAKIFATRLYWLMFAKALLKARLLICGKLHLFKDSAPVLLGLVQKVTTKLLARK